ncbi:MAG: hypothetical protein AB4057_03075 [Crocosphaera sp.]
MTQLYRENKKVPKLKLLKKIEDGSATTFIYEDPNKSNNKGFLARLKAKIRRTIKSVTE